MSTQTAPQLTIRPGDERGRTMLPWLDSRHSFSFGQYYDPGNVRFRSLRVINDDIIAPGGGFDEHGHDNMEILTWVLDGALKHGDSLGHMRELRHGELQAMSAGSGIRHSEFNASRKDPVRLLQIWLTPSQRDVEPRYLQEAFDPAGRRNQWQTVASGRGKAHESSGDDAPLPIHQDAELRIAELDAGAAVEVTLDADRHAYLHVGRGGVTLGDESLRGGDAATLAGPASLTLRANAAAEVLLFDLA